MSTLTVADIPLDPASPAQRLRRLAAAVRVHFTWWGTRKTLSNDQKEEVGNVYDADSRLLSASKRLVDVRHESFRRLTAVRTSTLKYWRGLTLPYVEAGVRLIRQCDIEGFVRRMNGFGEELLQAEADLNAVYGEIKDDARRGLGKLYDAADYPPEVKGLFHVEFDFPSVEPPRYLLGLHPELYHQEQERISKRFEEAVQLAEQAFVAEFSKLVAHLTERLSGGEGGQTRVFRDSVVSNLTEFFERFRKLNVQSNQDLDHLVEQAQQLVRGVQPQELRDNDGLRQHIAAEMTQVQTQLETMMVDRPRRQILRANRSRNGVHHANLD
jgi:hypothetical protein